MTRNPRRPILNEDRKKALVVLKRESLTSQDFPSAEKVPTSTTTIEDSRSTLGQVVGSELTLATGCLRFCGI